MENESTYRALDFKKNPLQPNKEFFQQESDAAKSTHRNPWSLYLFFVLLILIAIGMGMLRYGKIIPASTHQPIKISLSPTKVPDQVETPSQNTIEISDTSRWLEYQGNGFRFQYPAAFGQLKKVSAGRTKKVDNTANSVQAVYDVKPEGALVLTVDGPFSQGIQTTFDDWQKENLLTGLDGSGMQLNVRQITVAGKVGYINTGLYPNELIPEESEVYFLIDKKVYRLGVSLRVSSSEKTPYAGLLDGILSTFVFNTAKQQGRVGSFCGGIAGIACPQGLTCKYDGNYPDAGGKCE